MTNLFCSSCGTEYRRVGQEFCAMCGTASNESNSKVEDNVEDFEPFAFEFNRKEFPNFQMEYLLTIMRISS